MSYLEELDWELWRVGIWSRRRARILAEFSDHLHENPDADLGSPRDLARQFADELATRRARRAATIAFGGLAVAGLAIAAVVLVGTRVVLLPPNTHQVGFAARDSGPVAPLFVLAAEVAFAAGMLAILRAWRLRRTSVITAADAAILYRRAGIALFAGIVTVGSAPIGGVIAHRGWLTVRPIDVAGPCALLLLVIAVLLLLLSGLRPTAQGAAEDLTFDLGIRDRRLTPWRIAVLLSTAIFVLLALAGVAADDPYDGIARGLLDAGACMVVFIVLGRYLGLRTTGSVRGDRVADDPASAA